MREFWLVALVAISFGEVTTFEFCPPEFQYVDGIGCLNTASYTDYPDGLDWYASYFYCENIGGALVKHE